MSREGDVSIFFFAGHGDYRSSSPKYAGRLICKNRSTWLELPALAERLSRIKGKVIVLLESCGPGAAVREYDDDLNTTVMAAADKEFDDTAFTDAVIAAFSAADPGLAVYRSAESAEEDRTLRQAGAAVNGATSGNRFLTEKFIVMTASAYKQASYMYGADASNLFPTWLTRGVGTSGAMPADVDCGDSNGLLTVQELFQYVYDHTAYRQTPQVWPQYCDYELFRRR